MAGILHALTVGAYVPPGAIPPGSIHINISGYANQYNLYNDLISKGWNGTTVINIEVTIAPNGIVYSNNTAVPAFDTGTGYPAGCTFILTNNGLILGAGGQGGNGGYDSGVPTRAQAGYIGGTGLYAQIASTVVNNNLISGGGGGGGAGGSDANGTGGGGGGGGVSLGAGGISAVLLFGRSDYGTSATLYTPGIGGVGSGRAGSGGNGGTYGTVGNNGNDSLPTPGVGSYKLGGFGGAAGAAVVGNANITWTTVGDIRGALT